MNHVATKAEKIQNFSQKSLPDKNEESWRNLDLSGFSIENFDINASEIESRISFDSNQAKLYDLTKNPDDSPGVDLQAIVNDSDFDYFDEFNRTCNQNQQLLVVHSSSEEPIKIEHNLKNGDAIVSNTIIYIKPSVQAVIIEEFVDHQTDKSILLVPQTIIIAGQNSNTSYSVVIEQGPSDWNFFRLHTHLLKDSNLTTALVHTGAAKSKIVCKTRVLESGAQYRGIGIRAGALREVSDVEMIVSHLADHTSSSLLYKAVLNDFSRSLFTGNLEILPGLKNVNSYQQNHNLLLANTARAQSMPHLVIKAEEVSCEHGATVGALDKDSIFYLMSRGISMEQARMLLIEAFLKSTIDEFSSEFLQKKINQMLLSRLSMESLLEITQ